MLTIVVSSDISDKVWSLYEYTITGTSKYIMNHDDDTGRRRWSFYSSES